MLSLAWRLWLHPIVGSNDPKPDPIYASLRLAFHPKCALSARKCIAQYRLKFQIIHCQFFFWIRPWRATTNTFLEEYLNIITEYGGHAGACVVCSSYSFTSQTEKARHMSVFHRRQKKASKGKKSHVCNVTGCDQCFRSLATWNLDILHVIFAEIILTIRWSKKKRKQQKKMTASTRNQLRPLPSNSVAERNYEGNAGNPNKFE